MKSLGWLTGCALALACAHEGKSVAGDSDTKMQGTLAAEMSQPQAASTAEGATAAIRPFQVNVPEKAIVDLRQRIAATRWPDREIVTDRSQGAQLAKIQALVRYWGSGYDWRKAEAKLNALPQFMTNIDGLDVHFIHVRSRHKNALPVIITHGARAWDELMRRLGYTRYVSQGGDWGAVISDVMARQAPPGLLGIHINMPATVPPEIAKVLASGGPAPAGLSPEEKVAFDGMDALYKKGSGYALMMVTRPQTLGYSLADSPVGLAAWFYDKFADWTYSAGEPEKVLTRDEMLDDITLYWLTNTGTSSAQLYWENNANNFNAVDINIPAAITVFPGEIYRAPRSWAQRAYHKLIYFNEVDNGGHFAAWEQPELFATEIRAAFKSLRPADRKVAAH